MSTFVLDRFGSSCWWVPRVVFSLRELTHVRDKVISSSIFPSFVGRCGNVQYNSLSILNEGCAQHGLTGGGAQCTHVIHDQCSAPSNVGLGRLAAVEVRFFGPPLASHAVMADEEPLWIVLVFSRQQCRVPLHTMIVGMGA